MRILFIGDIVGKGGRQAIRALVPGLLTEYACDFCVANGENMAGGNGFTRQCVQEMDDSGVDVFTGGDHMWDQKEFVTEIAGLNQVLRPANLPDCQPGRGWGVFTARNGAAVAVMSLLGRTFMSAGADCPFATAERLLPEIRTLTPVVLVDFHAEATSEKIALGRYLDGKVSAVLGTHTHVATADQQVFPGGTAFQCDLGMVGARESVLGRELGPVLSRFRTGLPARFTVNDRGIRLCGAVVTVGPDGRAQGIERVMRDLR
ncbi:MAG: TIGR00282 family metallophosphoesterase [Lentisphaeria bacterium]|jgi:metallophosphoesterase (TIGR00282 family)|nr:TIGR00282 family metallophosphoesterase [Lentisphaeria bacterium]